MGKPKCMLTVDVEALPRRAASDHVDTLIYGSRLLWKPPLQLLNDITRCGIRPTPTPIFKSTCGVTLRS